MVELLMRNVLIVPMTANAPIPIAITVVSVVLQYFKVISVRLVMSGYMPTVSVATVWAAPKFVIRDAMLLLIDIGYLFAIFIKENVSVFMSTVCSGDALHTIRDDERERKNDGCEFFHDDLPPVFSSVSVCGRVTYRGYMLELGRELLKPLDCPPIHSAITLDCGLRFIAIILIKLYYILSSK